MSRRESFVFLLLENLVLVLQPHEVQKPFLAFSLQCLRATQATHPRDECLFCSAGETEIAIRISLEGSVQRQNFVLGTSWHLETSEQYWPLLHHWQHGSAEVLLSERTHLSKQGTIFFDSPPCTHNVCRDAWLLCVVHHCRAQPTQERVLHGGNTGVLFGTFENQALCGHIACEIPCAKW